MDFKENLKFGEEGEKQIAELLIKDGNYILPLYQFDANHPPYVLGQTDKYISPDLIVLKNNEIIFIEVKRKNKWNTFGNMYQTGVDYRKYIQYKELSLKTGIPFNIYFIHETMDPIGIYVINILHPGNYWSGEVAGKKVYPAMYFWNLNSMTKIDE